MEKIMDKVGFIREIHFSAWLEYIQERMGREELETSIENSTIAPKGKEKWW